MDDLKIGTRTVNRLAYDRLSALLFTGQLSPGERLDERLLAERMGISRTPLREAISQLASSGIVEHRPYQGNFVRTFTRKQMYDLYEVRKELEALAVRLAAPQLVGKGLSELRETVERCRRALEAGDIEEFEQTDRDFHATILRYAKNDTLTDSMTRLGLHIQLMRHLANREEDRLQQTMREREIILDAFTRGDIDLAAETMRLHIEGARDAALGQLVD